MIFTYVPPNTDKTKCFAQKVLLKNDTACVNILPPRSSIYLWPNDKRGNKLCESTEIITLFKSTDAQKQHPRRFIEEEYFYDYPATISINVEANQAFETWLDHHSQNT